MGVSKTRREKPQVDLGTPVLVSTLIFPRTSTKSTEGQREGRLWISDMGNSDFEESFD